MICTYPAGCTDQATVYLTNVEAYCRLHAVRVADREARMHVLARDRYRCRLCRRDDRPLEWAHIIAKGMGNANRYIRWDPDNAVTLCHPCHQHMTDHPVEWRAWIALELGEQHLYDLGERQRDGERRGARIDVAATIALFRGDLTPAQAQAYAEGRW